MRRRSGLKLALLAALATCALAAGPLTSQAAAVTPTRVVAHSTVADITLGNTQAILRLRPNANVYNKLTNAPIASIVVQFFGSAGQPLCADRTNNDGYAQCDGLLRLGLPVLLGLGSYKAKVPAQTVNGVSYGASQDTGQILTITGG